jgi:hypothetical protein
MQPWGSGYRTQSADTSIVAERVQFDCYRAMTPLEKLEIILDLCSTGRELSLAGLRMRHPSASDEELELREAALRLGPELAGRVYGRRFDELAG